jgi:serine O-acetyltransferase
MLAATIGVLDVLFIYFVPIAFAFLCWTAAAACVYLLASFSESSALRGDLEHRIAAKRQLPSGSGLKLSYRYVALSLLGDNCVQATALYRIARWLALRRLGPAARFVHSMSKLITHADISPYAEIGPGLFLYHGLGTVIGKGTRIGRRAVICQNVTVGGGPVIGDDVKLWSGSRVIGRISVGSRSEIGANGVVVHDVPPDVIAVGVPATRFLPKETGVPIALSL